MDIKAGDLLARPDRFRYKGTDELLRIVMGAIPRGLRGRTNFFSSIYTLIPLRLGGHSIHQYASRLAALNMDKFPELSSYGKPNLSKLRNKKNDARSLLNF